MSTLNSKINFARLTIGIVLLIGLIKIFLNIYNDFSTFEILYGKKLTLGLELKLIYNARTFLYPLILLLAILGFFMRRPLGWILTTNAFTFLLALIYLIFLPADNLEWYYYLTGILPIGLIVLMNQKQIVDFYKINKPNLLTLNMLVIVTGLAFAFLWGHFSLNPGENHLDIIYGK
ncbi:hypothetical protein [uncultured Draconibacterium sp.]|uniref:hypothetical protein n=1 Tax=uncultured Draconibacterium sp. TaxID=1573823 RepID=UPI002AA84F67|nr:hypothetical protein [uncultured Draconibacterium sp.]